MATVINRTTLQLIQSANTPDYPTEDWIHSPDLSAVSSVEKRYWKIVGETVVEMTSAEKDTAHLPDVKQEKFAAIDARTDVLIGAGFVHDSKTFSLTIVGQIKMMGTRQVKDDPALTYPIEWNTIDDLDKISIANAAALHSFYLSALGAMRTHLDGGTALKDSVRAATTIAGVDAIVDTR